MARSRSDTTIRAARGDDFEAVAALLEELGRPAVRDATRDEARAVFRQQVLDPDAHHLVAEAPGGRIAGVCSLHFRGRLNHTTEEAWIPDLFVAPSERRKGIGRALLEEAERRARARGCWHLTLESGHQRAEAHQLYRSFRMRDTGKQFSKLLTTLAVLALVVVAGCGGGGGSAAGHERSQSRNPARGHVPPRHRFVALARPANPRPRTVRVPVLTYHRVHAYATELTKSQPDLTVEPDTFRAEMEALERAGYETITTRRLFDALYRGAALPRKPVIVSVDDGYVDDVTQVLPVLRRLHMVATFYVITGRVHEGGFMSKRQIRSLEAAGMEIGAHTRTHPSLPALAPAALRAEVDGSAHDLRAILGHPVYWFAYPAGAFDASVEREVTRAGFLLAFTTRGGTTASATAPLELPRIHVGRTATPQSVVALAGG